MTRLERLALVLASMVWDDDVPYVELDAATKQELDLIALALIQELTGADPTASTATEIRQIAVKVVREELGFTRKRSAA